MSQAKREIPHVPESTGIEAAVAFSDTVFGSVQTALKAMTDWQQEMLTFTTHRIERNAEAYGELLRCKSFDEMSALQQNWAKSASKEYSEHLSRLAGLTQTAIQSAMPANGETKKRHH